MRVKPKSEWTIIEDVNDPIVSKELFEQANMSLRTANNPDFIIGQKYPLKGKLRCGNCRHTLTRAVSTYKEYYYCSHGAQIDDFSSCCTEQYPVEQMEDVVWRTLKEHIQMLKAIGIAAEAEAGERVKASEDHQSNLCSELELLKEQKVRQYEAYADGRMEKTAYIRKIETVRRKIEEVEKALDSQRVLLANQRELLDAAKEVVSLSEKHEQEEKLTFEAVDDFIDAVYVYEPGKIEFLFRFEDSLRIFQNDEAGCCREAG